MYELQSSLSELQKVIKEKEEQLEFVNKDLSRMHKLMEEERKVSKQRQHEAFEREMNLSEELKKSQKLV